MGVSMRRHPTVSTRSVPHGEPGGAHKSQTSFLSLLLVVRGTRHQSVQPGSLAALGTSDPRLP